MAGSVGECKHFTNRASYHSPLSMPVIPSPLKGRGQWERPAAQSCSVTTVMPSPPSRWGADSKPLTSG